jgi:sugar O-acyltransferase (sialic acid O-acetyltransferase NeuD family)
MKKLVIFGAAYLDLIKLVDAINRSSPTWELLGFIDDTEELQGKSFFDYPVLGTRELIPDLARDDAVHFYNNVHGHWTRTELIADLLDAHGCRIADLIHPSIDMSYVEIGRGCILPDGCVVGSNTRIGDFVAARLHALISHDVTVEDYAFVGPGAVIGGYATLGKGCFIGAGATVMTRRTVGAGSVVGAGAVVTRDVLPETTVAGNPAKELIKTKQA